MNSIQLRDVITGLIKSVAFATIIAHVGCLEGFRVRGGPDSVGRSTTSAVVKSTFLVIVADAIFTTIFISLCNPNGYHFHPRSGGRIRRAPCTERAKP
jgi:phospholipid/cholesterol/gamma-HCH transport system permease protein